MSLPLDQYTVKDAPVGHELHHPHELSVCTRDDEYFKSYPYFYCKLCKRHGYDSISDVYYVCKMCKSSDHYVLHKSCGDLAFQISHSFHPSHGHLRLVTNIVSLKRCISCRKGNVLFYECNVCGFRMDVECALMPTREGDQQHSIQHITHPHSLLLVDQVTNIHCHICESSKFSGPAYGCSHCNYFLHKSCTELPSLVQEFFPHPLHPQHPRLSVLAFDGESFTCNICEIEKYDWNACFKCDDRQCSFRMCRKCAKNNVRKSIRYEDHQHLLCYVDEAKRIGNHCNAYDGYCTRIDLNSEEFKRTDLSIVKCIDCDFKLHLLCGPLPSTIKHDCHIHSLALLDSLVEDDFGEYYCDVCETHRDPRIRVYHCKDCKYTAHAHCVISEILKVLKGELKGVELNALGKDYWSQAAQDELGESTVLTLRDLILQLTENEKDTLKLYYNWDDTSSKDKGDPEQRETLSSDDEEIRQILQLSRFDDSAFNKLCDEFESFSFGERLELKSSDLGLKLVKVKDYMIPYPLVNVLKTLLREFGDIANNSYHSLEVRSFIYFIVCQVVKRMRATLVKDITKHLLQEWYYHLTFLRYQGFMIDFAFVQFERLVDVFLGLQAKKLEDEVPKILNIKMAELRLGLEKCNEYKGSSQKSEYMKYCLEKASDSNWNYSFDFSIKDKIESLPIPRQPRE